MAAKAEISCEYPQNRRDHKLAALPGVQRITSTIVMKRIVDNRPLPLPGTRSRKVRGAATTPDRQRTSSPGRRT